MFSEKTNDMKPPKKKGLGTLLRRGFEHEQAGLIIALVILFVVMSILSPYFLTKNNIMNVLRQVSLVAIVGIGMTMIILSGEIDLSVGSALAVVGVASVTVLNLTGSVFVALLAALGIGAVIGAINGFLVTQAKINSLIATLGMMAILRGFAMVTTEATAIQTKNEAFQMVGTGYWGPFPIPVIIMIGLFILFYYILHFTTFGRYVYAIGGNSDAARLAGLPVSRMKMLIYIVGGVLTALSAFILASRMNSGQPNAGVGFELEVIGAVILGGISLTGGVGTLLGAFIGMFIIGILSNGLILLNVSSFWQDIARGIVIILAVYLDTRRKSRLQQSLVESTE